MAKYSVQKYPKFKDSGVKRIGEIPEHWEVKKVRNLFRLNKGLTITKENLQDNGIPCVNYGEIHSKYGFEVNPTKHPLKCVDNNYLKSNPSSLLGYGDFVFADTSEDLEGSGNFTYLNSCEQTFAGYHTVIARLISNDDFRYVAYFFDSLAYRVQIRRTVKGVKVLSITQTILKNSQAFLPPLPEQTAIAEFLDDKVGKIDEAIAQKEEMIALLKERKQIIIQNAVTQGLDPNVPMKDSGIEWIGEIPEHWEVKKVKHLFHLIIDPAPNNNEMELLSIYTAIGVRPRKDLKEKGNRASTKDGYWIVKKGDFIVNKLLAWMGAIGLSDYEGVTSPAYDILRPIEIINAEFYHYLFRSPICISEFKKHSKGIMDMRLRLYFDEFGQIQVTYPPMDEQDKIVRYIERALLKIDQMEDQEQQAITTLKEYKATLINSAVTGKIKVTVEGVETH